MTATNGNSVVQRIPSIPGMFDRIVPRDRWQDSSIHFALPQPIACDLRIWIHKGSRTEEFAVEYDTCWICNKSLALLTMTPLTNGEYACNDCKHDYTRVCDECGRAMVYDHPLQKCRSVINKEGKHIIVCKSCASNYFQCDVCHQWHYSGNAPRVLNDKVMCTSCYSALFKEYKPCVRCGTHVHRNLVIEGCCISCYQARLNERMQPPSKEIHDYGITRGIVFLATDETPRRFLGWEIEAQNGHEPCDQPHKFLQDMYRFKELVLKEDASVPEGVEVVSYPATLNYHRTLLDIPAWCKVMTKHGFYSDSDSNAGFHVHVSRASFGNSERKRSRAIACFTYLWQNLSWRPQLKIFSRRIGKRRDGDDFGYCKFFYEGFTSNTIVQGYRECVKENYKHRNTIVNFHRHVWDNHEYRSVVNEDTVEVRLFKGALRPSTIYATLELVDLFADIAVEGLDDEALRAITWKGICERIPSTSPSLVKYLKRNHIWEVN